jgi:hypothetical protein
MDKKEKMFVLVEQWRGSGLTRSVFSQQQGIDNASFNYWCKKHYNEVMKPRLPVKVSHKPAVKALGFVELPSGNGFFPKDQPVRMELELPGGIRIKIY